MSAPALASDAAVFAIKATLRIILDLVVVAIPCYHAAVTVRGVLTQTDIRNRHQRIQLAILLDCLQRLLHDSVSAHAPVACSSFSAGKPKSSNPPTPSATQVSASFTASSIDRLNTPGIELMGLRTPSPGQINSG